MVSFCNDLNVWWKLSDDNLKMWKGVYFFLKILWRWKSHDHWCEWAKRLCSTLGQKGSLSNGYKSLKQLTAIRSIDTRKIKQKPWILLFTAAHHVSLQKWGKWCTYCFYYYQLSKKKKKRNLLAGQHFTKNLTQQGPFFYFPPYKVVTSSAYTVWGT